MAIVLCDGVNRRAFLPFTYNHAIADITIGTGTILEWWQKISDQNVFVQTAAYLEKLYLKPLETLHYYVDARVIAAPEIVEQIFDLKAGEALADENGIIALHGENFEMVPSKTILIQNQLRLFNSWQINALNDVVLKMQTRFLKKNFHQKNNTNIKLIGTDENLFLEEGVKIEDAIINTSYGPVYISEDAVIMEGSLIRGPFFMGKQAVLKMGSKIYGATTLASKTISGGEIKNSVLMPFSNKAHDGYLGDSVIGAWCNLGAGTSNSNIKNTAASFHPCNADNGYTVQKAGVLMGDYTRTAINTRINTGSLIGVCCNILSEEWPPSELESFTWLNNEKQVYAFEKAIVHINNWMRFKGESLTENEENVLNYIFEHFTIHQKNKI